jgi:glycine oxidase
MFCVAGGAWSKPLLADFGVDVSIEPVRGQIVLLSQSPVPFRCVIQDGARYLVPRPDGRILIGSTEEHVGFLKENTAGAIAELIEFATARVPQLAAARVERTWAGLRPGSADGLPYMGQVPGTENVFVAAGHFRSGLQMSPGSALLMRELILGSETSISLEPFACNREHARIL